MPTITPRMALDVDGQLVQRVDSYLRGEATRAIRRGNYSSVNRFMSARIRAAVRLAENMTRRKYPMAKLRDERRRPVPGAPHLEDSWGYTPARHQGGVSLYNTRPNAAMLVLGHSKEPTITPLRRFSEKHGGPVLIFPRRGYPQHLWASPGNVAKVPVPVRRPVPASQRPVDVNESIPYRAIRQSFRHGAARSGIGRP